MIQLSTGRRPSSSTHHLLQLLLRLAPLGLGPYINTVIVAEVLPHIVRPLSMQLLLMDVVHIQIIFGYARHPLQRGRLKLYWRVASKSWWALS